MKLIYWGGRWGSRSARVGQTALLRHRAKPLIYKSPVVPHKDSVELTLADLL